MSKGGQGIHRKLEIILPLWGCRQHLVSMLEKT